MNYLQYTVKTNFGVTSPSVINEYGPLSNSLVSGIVLPDGSSYTFTYEQTPGTCTPIAGTQPTCVTGRIASVTLPTGGQVTYTYSGGNNGIESDGSTAGFTRTLNPSGAWQYARTQVSGAHWQTQVTSPPDPVNSNSASDVTVIDFQQDSATTNPTHDFYETQRQIYQGSSAGGTLLLSRLTCYNAIYANCVTATVASPIAQRDGYRILPGGKTSLVETVYNGFGLVTDRKDYDFGVTTGSAPSSTYLVREIKTTYASLGNGIANKPATVIVTAGGSTYSSITYSYDETAVTATSGTPQHVSISGSRGNVTTMAARIKLVGASLYKKVSYYDTGTPNVATDVSLSATSPGPSTTYIYGSGSCGNSFPTQIQEPLTLSRSIQWNCTGGVATSVTDENGKIVTANFNDADFWRPTSVLDQLNNTTAIAYGAGHTVVEGSMSFNGGNSISDVRSEVDGFGRHVLTQRLQGPSASNYDTGETDYDAFGRPSRNTVPFSAAAGGRNSTAPATTTSYDAIGRISSVSDGGGGTVSYTHTQNDTLQVLGPAPMNESAKQKQFEYDGLGRMTSVCEITSLTGSGNCAQTSLHTGYWTKYTYDPMGNLKTVTQNAQAAAGSQQARTFAYDLLNRLTSEANPETGTTLYYYDSLTGDAACGTVSFPGNLVKKVDAVGNSVCYSYDALHRMTAATYPSGAYSGVTPSKHFVYDSATVNSATMSNAKGRMAEAYTCTGACSSKIADEGFSYSARGELTDVLESTPHSSGYYHVNATYWENGALKVLNAAPNALPGLPQQTYGPDGEGRPSSVTAASGQNPVTGTAYDLTNYRVTVNFGSLDSDVFTFDTHTGRMNQYKYNVGSQSVTGNLTWNANGSLATLGITDQLNAADTQTCNFSHDDLARIASVTGASCPAWSQTFTPDPFGNITKSGTISFLPTYSPSTNRFLTIPGGTPTYDANGNLTYDVSHSYTWDAEGKALSIDTVNLTYDALGRMVEQNRSGVYTQIVYGPAGGKLALMTGQSLQKAFVPLPTGATAVYNSAGLAYYRHADWLGSSRLATTPTRTKYYDVAYAPYGESYAGSGTTDLDFTGQNQDTVSGMFDFLFREYHPVQGRWISPDPAGLSAVNPANPQSWNRYAYVLNRPTSLIDPLGLWCIFTTTISGDDAWNTLECGDGAAGGGAGGHDPQVPSQNDGEGAQSGGAEGGTPANNGKPPLPNTGPADQIAAHLSAYNQCVKSSPFNVFEPEKLEMPERPEGPKADMGVSPNEGTVPVPSNNDLFISTMKSCLMQYPLAALAPAYPGLSPGSVF
jgi:RHS repeat-associated protein